MGQSQDENTKPAPIEAEIIKSPTVLPRAVMVSPKQLQKQMERDKDIRAVINDYIKNNMIAGKDYGTIVINNKESKPSLFKPGAEKFCGLFKIRPTFKKDVETVEMLGNKAGIIAYICELVDSRGQVIGEGRGTASVDPNGKDFDINKCVKIAEKRAQIDAVLRAGGLSDFFTQDMEDAPRDGSGSSQNSSAADYPATEKQRSLINNKLIEIGVAVEDQAGYLVETYGVTVPLTKEGASFVIGEMIGSK
jgi:hypothetical protein